MYTSSHCRYLYIKLKFSYFTKNSLVKFFQVVGYIDLSDSEDENTKINQKKDPKSDSIIEILSSEEECERIESSTKLSETPKKRRGRPRKNPESIQSPQKEDNSLITTEEGKYQIIV